MTTTLAPADIHAPSEAVEQLVQALDSYHEPIPLADLIAWLQRTNLFVQDMGTFGIFREDRYGRNLIRETSYYELYCMCWRSGQASKIHDHGDSVCAVRVLEGCMTNLEFALVQEDVVRPVGSTMLFAGDIDGKIDRDVHQVANMQPVGEDLMTLHAYSPPLRKMKIFRARAPRS